MQTQNAIFDEIAKLMTEAAGAADGGSADAELHRQQQQLPPNIRGKR